MALDVLRLRNGSRCPFLEDEPVLEDIHVVSQGVATAVTRMFLNERWETDKFRFLHGADMLLPVCDLAERALNGRGAVSGVQKVHFRGAMTSNLELKVSPDRIPFEKREIVVDGVLATTEGDLKFAGRLTNKPIASTLPGNPFTAQIMGGMAQPSEFGSLVERPGLQAATLADVLTTGLVRALPRGDLKNRRMCGFSNLDLPLSVQQIFGGKLEVNLDLNQGRSIQGSTIVVPFSYQFSHQSEGGEGLVAFVRG